MHKIRDFVSFLLCFMLLAILGITSNSQEKGFEPSDFKERRDVLSSQIFDGVAIIVNYSGALARTWADPEFFYLTGVDIPDAKLILIPKEIKELDTA